MSVKQVAKCRGMLLDKVRRTLSRYRMLEPGEGVLVGVSGGPDSVALFHLLWSLKEELGFSLVAAHLNHRLRSEESDGDEDFVRQIATKLGVRLVTESVEVGKVAERESLNLEEAARRERYKFLLKTAKTLSLSKIAIGHTRSDQAETFLQRLLRGSGMRGLASIYPVKDGIIIRPLIQTSREEVIAYLAENNLGYRVDSSNYDLSFQRNYIRGVLLPLLEKNVSKNIKEILSRTAEVLREEDDFLNSHTTHMFNKLARIEDGEVIFDISQIREQHLATRRRLLREGIVRLKGNTLRLTCRHGEEALQLLDPGKRGKRISLPDKVIIERRGGELVIRRKEPPPVEEFLYEVSLPGEVYIKEVNQKFKLTSLPIEEFKRHYHLKADGYAFLDRAKLSLPLTVRNRRRGDHFFPLGGRGYTKLKKILINKKTPREERDKIPLFISQGEICWVAKIQIGERFKVTNTTQEVVIIERE